MWHDQLRRGFILEGRQLMSNPFFVQARGVFVLLGHSNDMMEAHGATTEQPIGNARIWSVKWFSSV